MSTNPCGCDREAGWVCHFHQKHDLRDSVTSAPAPIAQTAVGLIANDPYPNSTLANSGVFVVKDSGKRQQFESGMVRDIQEGKIDYSRALDGPMFERWAAHLTRAESKYPDVTPGVPNWTLAAGEEELQRFRKSALRHFIQWWKGQTDEDHAAAVIFNINGAEYVKSKR